MAPIRSQLSSPSFVKNLLAHRREVRATLSDVTNTNIQSTSSFYYDKPGDGLKSTQQLNVDWSQFKNHTFFNSAEANVNVSFDRIINHFPFDGTKRDFEVFFESLTGFEKWVYDRFPKNVGYLNFDSSNQTYISTLGIVGGLYPELSADKSGANILDPGLRSFSIESQIYVPSQSNGVQTIFQKLNGNKNGFSFFLASTGSYTDVQGIFAIVSGSESLYVSAPMKKGMFNHVCAILDRSPRKNRVSLYVNEQLISESTSSYAFGNLGCASSPFIIGSGTSVSFDGLTYTPTATLSASLDEVRFFHSVRTKEQQKAYADKSVFSTPDLKLYYKFNEPTGTLINGTTSDNGLVIDSSGNALHSKVTNFHFSMRSTGSVTSPLSSEKLSFSPVLFPYFTDTLSLNTNLLISASDYDSANPNLITKLIPSHYLLDGQIADGLETEAGNIGESYDAGTTPGTGQLGAAQLLASFLYVWGKFFDELKMYVDSFSNVMHVDYNSADTAPDNFLPFILKSYGFNIPSFFSDASIEQFIDAENIQSDFGTNQHALQFVQNQIHRRVLTNLHDIIKSKGTLHSVKSFIRALGIDPDNSFRIREFGGPTRLQLQHARELKTQPHLVLDIRDRTGYVISPPLSGSRKEIGFPNISGTMVKTPIYPPHGVSNGANDGLFTSGSFSFEGLYRFPVGFNLIPFATQSLMRMVVTGTTYSDPSVTDHWGTIVNITATSSSNITDIQHVNAYIRPTQNSNSPAPLLVMHLTGVNIFDGQRWNISFGRNRNDEFGSSVSSSYFLRAARQELGELEQVHVTSSYFSEISPNKPLIGSVFQSMSTTLNSSGSHIVIGNMTVPAGTSGSIFHFLNDSTNVTDNEARAGIFEGQVSMIRFWSRGLTENEWKEHVRNYKSLGVENPLKNFNFETVATGAFEKLRLDVPIEQTIVSASITGIMSLFDYSQNNLHMNAVGFTPNRRILFTDLFSYSLISPLFDEASSNDKVRVRGFQNYSNVLESSVASVAPVYDPEPSEPPMDDTRFSIEFSVIDALNRDMISIFATLDELDNSLGNPELLFSSDYPGLENLRKIYFNRLVSKINVKAFFEYFKWFDSSISSFIEQLIPRKTNFYGTNFVIESHMLERAKMRYHYIENYLGDTDRIITPRDIILQQFAGSIKKF